MIQYLKKYLLAAFVAVLVFMGFFSCDRQDELNHKLTENKALVKPSKQVHFIGQWLNEGKREKLVRDFVREYEFENQDVAINLEFPENIFLNGDNPLTNEQFVAKIIYEENPEWDIIRINNQYNEITALCGDSLWAKKYLVDFSKYPEFRRNTMPALVSDEVKNFWKGIIPGPFIEGQYYALWSNRLVADKVGIEIKQTGMTLDDFRNYIKAVYDYNKSNPQDKIVPFYDGSDWQTFFPLAYQLYASIINDYDLLYRIDANETKLKAWFQVLKTFEELRMYDFGEYFGELAWIDCGNEVLNEQALFYINGSWMYNIWDNIDSDLTLNCYPNEFPVVNNIKIFPGNYLVMWGVLKNSPNKDEAVKFLLAMNKPEVGDMWVNYTKCPTGINTTLSSATISSDQFEQFTHHVQQKYGKDLYQVGGYLHKYIVGLNFDQSLYLYEVIKGEISAQEAYDIMRANLGLN